MRVARTNSLPTLPDSLQDLAIKFDNDELRRFSCCDHLIFHGCIRDSEGKFYLFYVKYNLWV
jgi:hypothetical protein